MKPISSITATAALGLLLCLTGPAGAEEPGKAVPEKPFSFSLSVRPLDRTGGTPHQDGNQDGEFAASLSDSVAPPAASLTSHADSPLKMGLQVDTTVQAGPLSGGLIYFKSAEDRNAFNDAYSSYSRKIDATFAPMFILTGQYPDPYDDLDATAGDQAKKTDLQGLIVHAGFDVSEKLRLKGALGIAKARKETLIEDNKVTTESSYGWEIDLGASYKLFNNLLYEAHFGYLDTGDYFAGQANDQSLTGNVYDRFIYRLSHKLTMKF